MKINAKAKVQITVEVVAGSWGDGCSINQVHEQAKDSALQALRNVLSDVRHTMQITGEPKVIGIITEEA